MHITELYREGAAIGIVRNVRSTTSLSASMAEDRGSLLLLAIQVATSFCRSVSVFRRNGLKLLLAIGEKTLP